MGLAYFNIISLVIKQSSSLLTDINQNHLIHNAILTTNYLLYTFGLLGFYKLLILKNLIKKIFIRVYCRQHFSTNNKMLLTIIEIFAFSLITWSFILLKTIYLQKI